MNEVTIDGVVYIPKQDGMDYCIIRTRDAGVFAGYVKSRNGDEVELINSRRLWKWAGAASLSELSQKGVSKPNECKFPCEEPQKIALGVIEVIKCSPSAIESIKGVKVWTSR